MKFFSYHKGNERAKQLFGSSLTEYYDDATLRNTHPHIARYAIPEDTGVKNMLARSLAEAMTAEPGGMFFIGEINIWPSSEHWDLFDGYRASLGETRSVHDAPCHEIESGDQPRLHSLIALVLYFVCGGLLIHPSGTIVVEISHDEWLCVWAQNKSDLRNLQHWLNDLCKPMKA